MVRRNADGTMFVGEVVEEVKPVPVTEEIEETEDTAEVDETDEDEEEAGAEEEPEKKTVRKPATRTRAKAKTTKRK